jgi:deoxyribodipyrimidine photo-lyase
MSRVIHWFRRDLRLTDNTALYHARKESEDIVAVYILSTWTKHHHWTGPNRQLFLCGCLEDLAQALENLGSRLVIRSGEPMEALLELARQSKAEKIFYNRLYDPFDVDLEKRLATAADYAQIKVEAFDDIGIHPPGELLNQSGQPFRVFSPYARAWHKLPKPEPLPHLAKLKSPPPLKSLALPTLKFWHLQPEAKIIESGEKAAVDRLQKFVKTRVSQYGAQRNIPSTPATSRLSQDLRFGTLSARSIYHAMREAAADCPASARSSINSYINEIVWREFYLQVLWHHPKVLDENFNPEFKHLRWNEDDAAYQKWCSGLTGFPLVDAGMRELNATGFMHNRLRMIVAMFLTKDLHLHWRLGESYFMQKLVDGEIASNNGGWQWSAGTGADAAPYFRIQNPWNQTKAFDPEGEYIKRWVPELASIDPNMFLEPPSEPLAPDYPAPMVDHAKEREDTMQRFSRAKNR